MPRELSLSALLILLTLPSAGPAVSSESRVVFAPVASVQIEYQQSERRNADVPESVLGRYWGSGNGRIDGVLNGTVHWDLYEDHSRNELHPAILVGVIITDDRQRVPFKAVGMYKARGDGHWDLTASIDFRCDACGRISRDRYLWLGTVKWGEWIHRGEIFRIEP